MHGGICYEHACVWCKMVVLSSLQHWDSFDSLSFNFDLFFVILQLHASGIWTLFAASYKNTSCAL